MLESRPEVGAAFTAVETIDEEGVPTTGTWADGQFCDGSQTRTREEWLRKFFWGNCLCITSALVRHELLREVGPFRPSLVNLGDLDLWIRLAGASELHVIPEPLTRMRVGDRNLSAPKPGTLVRIAIEMVDVLENFARPPLIQSLPTLFPQACAGRSGDETVVNLATVACHAAAGGGVSHRLFADRVLKGMIDDPDSRRKIVEAFGSQVITFFYDLRTQWQISIA